MFSVGSNPVRGFLEGSGYAWHFLMRNQGIKEFDDKEFLTRKTDKENKEFTSQ